MHTLFMATPDQSDTIIGSNVELSGSLKNQGAIHIYGRVTGDVTSESSIVIGEGAMVTGPVSAKSITVSGTVQGSINVQDLLQLEPKSVVHGDIVAGRIMIKDGAQFNGTCQMPGASGGMTEHETGKKRPRLELD
jgi:cytoskeletal protein CcmA (bactofilin family)